MIKENNYSVEVCLKIAGLFGAIAIVLGAFGAHGLETVLAQNGKKALWEKATQYQFYHVLSLILLSILMVQNFISHSLGKWIGVLWTAGILLFSGSLYALALGVNRSIGWITPIGGLAFIAGWLIFFASIKK